MMPGPALLEQLVDPLGDAGQAVALRMRAEILVEDRAPDGLRVEEVERLRRSGGSCRAARRRSTGRAPGVRASRWRTRTAAARIVLPVPGQPDHEVDRVHRAARRRARHRGADARSTRRSLIGRRSRPVVQEGARPEQILDGRDEAAAGRAASARNASAPAAIASSCACSAEIARHEATPCALSRRHSSAPVPPEIMQLDDREVGPALARRCARPRPRRGRGRPRSPRCAGSTRRTRPRTGPARPAGSGRGPRPARRGRAADPLRSCSASRRWASAGCRPASSSRLTNRSCSTCVRV